MKSSTTLLGLGHPDDLGKDIRHILKLIDENPDNFVLGMLVTAQLCNYEAMHVCFDPKTRHDDEKLTDAEERIEDLSREIADSIVYEMPELMLEGSIDDIVYTGRMVEETAVAGLHAAYLVAKSEGIGVFNG